MGGFQKWVLDTLMGMIRAFDSCVDSAINLLTKDIFTGDMYKLANTVSKNVVTPFALTIITIVFLIEFLKITIKMDVLKWEYLLRVFFKLMFAKVAIDVSADLLSAIYATASDWILKIGTANTSLGQQVGTKLQALLNNSGFFESLGLLCTMGISFIAVWIAGVIVIVIAYARIFELTVYLAVAPLPCAFLPMEDGGGSRIPRKFFLSFAGVALQGFFMILSIKFYQSIVVSTLLPAISKSSSFLDISFNMLLGALVLVMAVVKSGSWAKSVLDS